MRTQCPFEILPLPFLHVLGEVLLGFSSPLVNLCKACIISSPLSGDQEVVVLCASEIWTVKDGFGKASLPV